MKRMKLLVTIALPVLLIQNVQAQSAAEKTSSITTISNLVGISNWIHDGARFNLNDSSALSYSAGRGGDLTHQMKFDNETTWGYVSSKDSFYNEFSYMQAFDASGNLTSNISLTWDNTVLYWLNTHQTLYWYNTLNAVTQKIEQTWTGGPNWINQSENLYSYFSTNNKLARDLMINWNSGTGLFSDTVSMRNYYYDVLTNNLTQELDYVYNAASQLFINSASIEYSYNSSNQLLSVTNKTWNGIAFVPVNMHSYTYDASGGVASDLYQVYNNVTGNWDNTTLNVFSGFLGKNPQTEIDKIYDTTGGGMWNDTMKYTYTYNSFSTPQLTSKTGQSSNAGVGWEFAAGDMMTKYYYSLVNVNGVKSIVSNGIVADIYPVPAQSNLNIDLNLLQSQNLTISILDMTGRTLKEWNVATTDKYSVEIPVSNFVNGNYLVKVTTTNGNCFTKEIVVAH